MLMGIRLQAHPSKKQKLILSRWMGCARFIWNAKCDDERYLATFARKYLPVGTYAPIDQKFSQYKDPELSPWLSECPSQILRNSAVNWYQTYQSFLKGECGKPRRKKKSEDGSIHLTKEVFRFEKCSDGVTRLFIGTKTNNIGYLSVKNHRPYQEPKSIYIKKRHGEYSVSFCYDDKLDESSLFDQAQHLKHLRECQRKFLETFTVGIDRGVVRPVQAGGEVYELTPEQKKSKHGRERWLKRYQSRLSRQQKGSRRRLQTKRKISECHQKIANIRKDFCHKTSRSIVSNERHKIIVLEDLRIQNMTAKPKARESKDGKWEKNGAKAKAGLNRSILNEGWHQLDSYIKYKAYRAGKAWFKVSAQYTSQECAACGHTHPNNRRSQERFKCEHCGHCDNADRNAAEVIKKRAIDLILDPGSGLSGRGVLLSDTGRGATLKTRKAKAKRARSNEASKKTRKATKVA